MIGTFEQNAGDFCRIKDRLLSRLVMEHDSND
jgi:hypothetical protein